MNLDALTRAQAEASHARLKNSLLQTSQAFCEHFSGEQDLFRTLVGPGAMVSGYHPSKRHGSPNENAAKLEKAVIVALDHDDDIVRLERLNQCCKRVRIWRRQVTNPLLQYMQQHHASGRGGIGGASVTAKKFDRRMHSTLLMAMIVDVFEQRIFTEIEGCSSVDTSNVQVMSGRLSSGYIFQESFPEFVVRFLTQRTSNRRLVTDQLHSMVSTVLLAAPNHARVRVFGSLCGIDGVFNPPEKIKVFLHILEDLYRCKIAASIGASGAHTARINEITTTIPLADAVFHNVGISQIMAQQVINDLFCDNFYWNFRFWQIPCSELHIDLSWPSGACGELQDKALTMAGAPRNALLNTHRKIDGDAFLELLLDTWTSRAQQLYAYLETATDREESASNDLLRLRQATQDSRIQHRPTTDEEYQLFEQLIEEHWNAPVCWANPKVQALIAGLVPYRPLAQLQQLYTAYVTDLPPSQCMWDWKNWPWETEWEWGGLVISANKSEH